MDAKEFLTTYSKECRSHDDCSGCPFERNGGCQIEFVADGGECIDRVIAIAEKLNHKKTYADDFFEKFPNAPRFSDGTPYACKRGIYDSKLSGWCGVCPTSSCSNCWDEPFHGKEKTK